jgi:predicted peptidase
MRRVCLVLALFGAAILTFPRAVRAEDAWRKLYEADAYTHSDGQKVPYRLMKPEKIEEGKKYPLILFLHGGGENGNDNNLHLYIGAEDFAKPENRQKHPCFALFPQCPKGSHWALRDMRWGLGGSPEKTPDPLDLSFALVEILMDKLPIDKDRIYVTGLCTGGVGTWTAIQRRPDFFAAAIPICGGGDTKQAEKVKNVPIWAFHGDQDTVVSVENTQRSIAAVIKAGGKPKMTIYPGVGHNSWSATYGNPEVLNWLFDQKKNRSISRN